jgi:ABC-type glycerol-3-phosphate transport system permease component
MGKCGFLQFGPSAGPAESRPASIGSVGEAAAGLLMAGTLLSTLPIIILFIAMQREFVSGITLGAVKE